MQKAYLQFSTISSIKNSDGRPVKSRWNDQISKEHKIHSELIAKMSSGERIEGIERDPLASIDSEYSLDYSVVPGFLKREQSTSGQDKVRIEPHAESLKFVAQMLEKGRDIRKKHEHALSSENEQSHQHHQQHELPYHKDLTSVVEESEKFEETEEVQNEDASKAE